MTERAKCVGHSSQTGLPCKNWPVRGAKVCHAHGGRARQVRRKAKERQVEEQAQQAIERYGPQAGPVTDPLSALLLVAGEITQFKDYLADLVRGLRAEAWRYRGEQAEQLRAEVGLYERALDRTARVLVDINRLGIEERQVRVVEQQGEALADVIMGTLNDLDLTDEQQARALEILPQRLRAISGP